MNIVVYFHGLTLQFDVEVEVTPAEKQTSDCPASPMEVVVTEARFNGELVSDESDQLWEAIGEAATEQVEKDMRHGDF